MKVILYMATSINGYITNNEDDSDWVSETDWEQFSKLLHESGTIVMGKKTYECFGDEFPVDGALNIVMTHDAVLLAKHKTNTALFTDKEPSAVIKYVQQQGGKQIMLIGGMTLNTSFIKENLVDELWLSVHPLFIGKGKTITSPLELFKNVTYLGLRELPNGLVQLRYAMK